MSVQSTLDDIPLKTYHVLLTGFGPQPFQSQAKVNPSWIAVKALHNMTISSDQWQEVFAEAIRKSSGGAMSSIRSSGMTNAISSMSNGKKLLGNGDASGSGSSNSTSAGNPSSSSSSSSKKGSGSGSGSTSSGPTTSSSSSSKKPAQPPLPPLPEPGPYNIHISALEIPMLYDKILKIVPGLHLKPPQLPEDLPEDFHRPPENGYDFIFHVGVAGRGALRMEVIGHKYGYNMKDASGSYCAVVPPPSSTKNNPARGPTAAPPGVVSPPGAPPSGQFIGGGYVGGGVHGGGFGSIGMGYNNERLGYNPAVHDPVPGSENSVRPMRGFGTAYEGFPDEMMTDMDVTRLVHDLKASGMNAIYTSMDAGHHLCDFIYYCSLAESKRSSKALMPWMSNSPFFTPSANYGPAFGPNPANSPSIFPGSTSGALISPGTSGIRNGNANVQIKTKPAQVMLMHCPPIKEPLSGEEVTEAIRRIVLWVCREIELLNMREQAMAVPEEGVAAAF